MALITREDLRKQLQNSEPATVYLLFGAETFLRDSAAKAITEKALKDQQLREFNEVELDLAQTDVQQAIAAAEQLPMISTRRVVRLSNVNKLSNEADEEVLARYIARPVPTSVLILLANELDKRKKITKTLLDSCVSVEFAPLGNDELMRWAQRVLRDAKAEIDDRTLMHVINLIGSDVRVLTNELNKLATAALPEGRITFELVEELVPNSREMSNFELTDYLIGKNRSRSLQILYKLLNDGAEPLMLLGLIAGNYHRLALAKEMMQRGAANEEVFRKVNMPFTKRDEFLAVARRTNAQTLTKSLERIAQADLAIKSSIGGGGATGANLQLEMLVCELTMP